MTNDSDFLSTARLSSNLSAQNLAGCSQLTMFTCLTLEITIVAKKPHLYLCSTLKLK